MKEGRGCDTADPGSGACTPSEEGAAVWRGKGERSGSGSGEGPRGDETDD